MISFKLDESLFECIDVSNDIALLSFESTISTYFFPFYIDNTAGFFLPPLFLFFSCSSPSYIDLRSFDVPFGYILLIKSITLYSS